MALKPQPGIRNASGLALSLECALWYWLAYAALLAAAWLAIGAELALRLPDLIGFYFIEAVLGLCAPLGVLLLCDTLTIRTYSAVWYDLRDLGRAELLLESQGVELIRRELRRHPLLAWLRPPPSRGLRAQLFTAALWYRPLLAPEGAGFAVRYGEQLGWAAAYLLLLTVPPAWLVALDHELFSAVSVHAGGALGVAAMLALFGWQQLLILARRQAISDYFTVHLDHVPER